MTPLDYVLLAAGLAVSLWAVASVAGLVLVGWVFVRFAKTLGGRR